MEQSLKYPVVPDTAMKSRRRYVRIVITHRIECGLGSTRKERTYGAKAIAVCKIPDLSSGVSRINVDDKKSCFTTPGSCQRLLGDSLHGRMRDRKNSKT